jgi:FAD synthetase
VLLHLLRAAVERRRRRQKSSEGGAEEKEGKEGENPEEETSCSSGVGDLDGVRSFTFERDDDFPEICQFVCEADKQHGLKLERITSPEGETTGNGYKDLLSALSSYLERTGVAAIVLGTRRGDPNAGGQDALCASSPGWPPFLRVNPVLEWGYSDVWGFLDAIGASYCSLYDRGFTSVGAAPSTSPNPALQRPDGSYAPARELSDGRTERAGRGKGGGGGGGGSGKKKEEEQEEEEAAKEEEAEEEEKLPFESHQPHHRSHFRFSSASSQLAPSAAIVLVGDELLSGRVQDANGLWLCRRLRAVGWLPRRLSVVPDDTAAIASEVSAAARAHPAVLVAGGVGPTDDDVTAAGVAEALRVPLARDADLAGRLRDYFGERLRPAHLKMADAPAQGLTALDVFSSDDEEEEEEEEEEEQGEEGEKEERKGRAKTTKKEEKKRSPFPLLAVACSSTGSTVYILPGVPHLLRRKWRALEAHLGTLPAAGAGRKSNGGEGEGKEGKAPTAAAAAAAPPAPPPPLAPFHAAALRLLLDDETAAAPAMAAASAAGGAIVSVGSYPLAAASCEDDDGWGGKSNGGGRRRRRSRRASETTEMDTPRGGDGATVCLLLESKDAGALSAAVEAAIGALPAESLVAAERDPEGLGGGCGGGGGAKK